MFNLKTALKASGWTVTKSSDGVTFNASGDQITTGTTGAGGMRVVKAWFVIQAPGAAFGFTRSFCIQNADATGQNFRIKYSAAGFTGGSPAILVTPTATDEQVIVGAGTDAAPTFAGAFVTGYGTTVPARQQIMVNNASPYEWYTVSQPQGGGDCNQVFAHDVMVTGSFDTLDVDPYVILLKATSSIFSSGSFYNTGTVCWAWYRKGMTGPLFTQISANQYTVGSNEYVNALGTNGYSSKDVVLPILYARTLVQLTAVGLKGQSTLFRWVGNPRPSGDTLSVVSTSDGICMSTPPNCVVLPWDGTVPLV